MITQVERIVIGNLYLAQLGARTGVDVSSTTPIKIEGDFTNLPLSRRWGADAETDVIGQAGELW
jgi:hypothetical protein